LKDIVKTCYIENGSLTSSVGKILIKLMQNVATLTLCVIQRFFSVFAGLGVWLPQLLNILHILIQHKRRKNPLSIKLLVPNNLFALNVSLTQFYFICSVFYKRILLVGSFL